jgi:hypothetical protein
MTVGRIVGQSALHAHTRSTVIAVKLKRSSVMTKLRLKTIAKLFAVSAVILTASPALATQMSPHNAHCRSCEQSAGAYRHQTFGPGVVRQSQAPRWNGANTTHDDWPSRMILG